MIMETPEAYLMKFLEARNRLFRRHQKELGSLQAEFCQGSFIYDKRLSGYEEEQVQLAVRKGNRAAVTTSGNIKGPNASRLLYELVEADGAWLIYDLWVECVVCRENANPESSAPPPDGVASKEEQASAKCKVCNGLGWISTTRGVEGMLKS